MKRLLARSLFTSIAATSVVVALVAAPSLAARPTTDKVTSGSWGQGVAVVDPTVAANDLTPSAYAAIDLKVGLTAPTLIWDNGPNDVIGGCGAPACLPNVMTPGVYRFPYVAGTGGVVPALGGHFHLLGTDSRGRSLTISVPLQTDTGFANLPSWAAPGIQVTTGSWGQGVAVVDPIVEPSDTTPSAYAAIQLDVTLTDPTLIWDNGPKDVIGGCGAPACLPSVMTPGVYKFPYVAGTGGVVPALGGHFHLLGTDSSGRSLTISIPLQYDPGFKDLPSWAAPGDQVTTGSWGQGVAVVDPIVEPSDTTPSAYAAIQLDVTLTDPTLIWDNGPNDVIGGCGAPACLPSVMTPDVYKFPYVAGTGGVVPALGGHFHLLGTDDSGSPVTISLPYQYDPGFAHLPSWAIP